MKICLPILLLLLVSVVPAVGQDTPPTTANSCPPDKVCLDRDQAAKYLTIEDTLKATEKENLTLKQAVLDKSIEILNVKIDLARVMGEKTGSDQMVVRLQAQNEFLLKNGRKKCGVFSICIQ